MLIRTQLGELVNLNNIGIVRISEENKLIATCNNEEYVLAEYKTKEKARKALEMLFFAYGGLRDVFDFSDVDS